MDDKNENARPGDEPGQAQETARELKTNSQLDLGSHAAAEADGGKPSRLRPYVEAGLQPIPLHPRDKRPRDRGWPTATYDIAKLERDFVAGRINIGIRLVAEVVVLDVDPRNFGKDGDSLAMLIQNTGLVLDGVPHTRTGSGGDHFWFAKAPDVPLLDSIEGYPGLELKSLGRQVVAAGSIHPCGKPYRWATDPVDLKNLPQLPGAVQALAKRPPPKETVVDEEQELTPEQLEGALEQLDPCDFGDQDEWLKLMMACHHATRGEARQEFIDWSTSDPEYADHAWIIGNRWDSLHRTGTSSGGRPITVRYLHKVLHDAGGAVPHTAPEDDFDMVEPGGSVLSLFPPDKKIAANYTNCMKALRFLDSQLGLAYDEFGRAAFLIADMLPWSVDIGRKLDDDLLRRIRQYLVEATGVNWGKDDVAEAVLCLVRERPYHPVRDYLAGLVWDGRPRLDTLLVDYAGAVDNAYVRAVGAKTLIAAVRRVRQPGCKFDNVIVLEGSQGCGKSSFVKALVPNEDWFSDSPIGNTESKDAPLSLQGKWIIELGEMSVLSKSGLESLKAFVSCSIDHVRRPYGRLHEELRRQCVFIGTTNQDAYLRDQTGNRRFWPVRVGTIDIAQLVADRDQLWAEASAREASGESLLLPQALWGMAAGEQEERVPEDPWADVLRAWLDGIGTSGPVEPVDRVHTSSLLADALGIPAARQTSADAHRLKVVMVKELGWVYKRNVRAGEEKKQGSGYQRTRDS